jgi:7-cyano-7-deazaguanine synthase
MTDNVIVIVSGGLDSTTLLYHLRAAGCELKGISVDYGQRHGPHELAAASKICGQLQIEHRTLNMTPLVEFLGQNSLSDSSKEVPEGRYEPETMQLTTVPNRNMILLSVGIAWAISSDFDSVAFGAHGGSYTPYPDCQPAFAESMDTVAGLCDWRKIRVLSPFIKWEKADIVRRGAELGVPFGLTWSCYKGGEKHCGQCGTCIDRKEAFARCGLEDLVEYEDLTQ